MYYIVYIENMENNKTKETKNICQPKIVLAVFLQAYIYYIKYIYLLETKLELECWGSAIRPVRCARRVCI